MHVKHIHVLANYIATCGVGHLLPAQVVAVQSDQPGCGYSQSGIICLCGSALAATGS